MSEVQLAELAERLGGSPVPGVHMAEQEFVEWTLNRVAAEWVDGEVVLMPPVSDVHDDLDTWLIAVLRHFVESRRLGVIRHNMFVRFARRRRRRVPDVIFIAEAHRRRIRDTFIDGAPDLIIEVVSPDSQNRDRREKYFDYEAAGVREYWIVDPLSRTLNAYALHGRKYKHIDPKDDLVHSTVLRGFFLRPKWLFGRQRPRLTRVLKELGVKL
jgi:Uma2 family endonuclease